MTRDELNQMLLIVDEALGKMLLAERTIDKRKLEKAVREAKIDAQNMVLPYRDLLDKELDINYNGELFSWDFIENDLRAVREKLTEMIKTNRFND